MTNGGAWVYFRKDWAFPQPSSHLITEPVTSSDSIWTSLAGVHPVINLRQILQTHCQTSHAAFHVTLGWKMPHKNKVHCLVCESWGQTPTSVHQMFMVYKMHVLFMFGYVFLFFIVFFFKERIYFAWESLVSESSDIVICSQKHTRNSFLHVLPHTKPNC